MELTPDGVQNGSNNGGILDPDSLDSLGKPVEDIVGLIKKGYEFINGGRIEEARGLVSDVEKLLGTIVDSQVNFFGRVTPFVSDIRAGEMNYQREFEAYRKELGI